MKIRNQKIMAMLLVSILSVGVVTVSVEAKSANSFNKTVSAVEGTKIDEARGLYFTMDFAAGELSEGATYFIEAEDFEFDTRAYRNLLTKDIEITAQNKTRLKIEVPKTNKARTVSIPIYGEVLKGSPRLVVDAEGSKATEGEYSITSGMVTASSALTISVKEIPNIAEDGTGPIADIQIIENVAGTLSSHDSIKLTLPRSSNLKFRMPTVDKLGYATSLKVEGLRGTSAKNIKVKVDKESSDSKVLILTLEGIVPSTAKGGVSISGLEVMPEDRNKELAIGDVEITFKMGELDRTELIVARVAQQGLNLKVKNEVSLMAGKESKPVEVMISENVAGSLNRRHNVYFEVKGANIVPGTLKIVGDSLVTLKEEVDAKTQEVVGFTLDTRKIDPLNITKVTFAFEISANADSRGNIVLVADSNKFEEKVKLGEISSPIEIKLNPIQLRTALKDQVGGQIRISEANTDVFSMDDEIVIGVEQAGEGITFTGATIESEDLRVKNMKFVDGKIVITIERGSDEGGSLVLSNLEICVDGLVEEGSYDVVVSGSGISDHKDDKLVIKDILRVGEEVPKEEATAANGLEKGTAQFKMGDTTYIVNEEVKKMDAAPYLSDLNRVMVPAKYVTDAFGVKGNQLKFSNENGGTITIEAGLRTVQLVNGSNIAIVNGVPTPMDEKVTLVDGRTYVPVGPMARILDIEVDWSNTNKTATFTNK